MDVAGDEGSNPLSSSDHKMATGVKSAVAQGMPVTVHAGEWPEKYGTLKNVRYTVKGILNMECLATIECLFSHFFKSLFSKNRKNQFQVVLFWLK